MTRLLLVRQYAVTTTYMGVAHIAEEGTTATLCGQELRATAVWGPEVPVGVDRPCHICRGLSQTRYGVRKLSEGRSH